MLSVEYATQFIPPNLIDIESAANWLGITQTEAKVFKRIYGLQTIPIAKNTSTFELIKYSIEKLITNYCFDPNSIKLIIHVHTAQIIAPFGISIVNQIKNYFKFNQATAFSTSLNNCAAVLNALEIAEKWLNKNEKALIIIGEQSFTQSLRLVPNISVTADAAVSVLVNKDENKCRLLSITIDSYGKYAGGLWMEEKDRIQFETQFPYLLKKSITKILQKNSVNLSDIKLLLPHNINVRLWYEMAKVMEFPPEKIYTENIAKYAHCFGSDIFINLISAIDKNLLQPDDYFLMVTAGLGATIGVALFQY